MLGMQGLNDHAPAAAHRFRRRPEGLEGALAGAEVWDAQEPVEGDETYRAEAAERETSQHARPADHHLRPDRARARAGHRQRREALAHRRLDALGTPAEGRETMAAAARAAPPAPARGGRRCGSRAALPRARARAATPQSGQRSTSPHSSQPSAAAPRETTSATRRPRRPASSMARVRGSVRGWLRRMPRVSAAMISGQASLASGAAGAASLKAPDRAWCQRLDRGRAGEQYEPAAFTPGPLHEELARVQPRGARRLVRGVALVERAPAWRVAASGRAGPSACPPPRAAGRARRRTRPRGARRRRRRCPGARRRGARPRRAADSMSGATTSTGPSACAASSASRASRARSVQSSGITGAADAAGIGGGATLSTLPRRGAGGSSAARVEPGAERLSAAAQRPRSSITGESTGAGSSGSPMAASPAASASRSASHEAHTGAPLNGRADALARREHGARRARRR